MYSPYVDNKTHSLQYVSGNALFLSSGLQNSDIHRTFFFPQVVARTGDINRWSVSWTSCTCKQIYGKAYTNFQENTILHVYEELHQAHFLHDGIPAHFNHTAGWYLDRWFSDRCISRGGPIAWPPHSPAVAARGFKIKRGSQIPKWRRKKSNLVTLTCYMIYAYLNL